jgi:site-specific recombinase XerD
MGTELVRPDTFAIGLPDDTVRRLTNLTEIWLHSFKSQNTRIAYRRALESWIALCAASGTEPSAARIAHADMWIEQQRIAGSADRSIAHRVSAVSSWYGYLIINTAEDAVPLATRNPMKTKAKPKIDPTYTPTVSLDGAEADRLITAADEDSLIASALIRLLLAEGLRIGSAINATIADLGHDKGHRILVIKVKGGKPKKIPLPPFVSDRVDRMLAARGNPEDGPLFLTTKGRPLYELWVWRLVRRLGRKAGVPQAAKMSPHSLRHTAITEYLEAGASIYEAQKFAGHADPRTTQIYDHAIRDLDQHGSYVLAGRYGKRRSQSSPEPVSTQGEH